MNILNDTNDGLVVIRILIKLSKSEYSKGETENKNILNLYIYHLRKLVVMILMNFFFDLENIQMIDKTFSMIQLTIYIFISSNLFL